jgi:hypothetical protein
VGILPAPQYFILSDSVAWRKPYQDTQDLKIYRMLSESGYPPIKGFTGFLFDELSHLLKIIYMIIYITSKNPHILKIKLQKKSSFKQTFPPKNT